MYSSTVLINTVGFMILKVPVEISYIDWDYIVADIPDDYEYIVEAC